MSTPLASRSLMRNWLPLTSLGIPFMVNGTTRSGLSRFDHLIFGSPLSEGKAEGASRSQRPRIDRAFVSSDRMGDRIIVRPAYLRTDLHRERRWTEGKVRDRHAVASAGRGRSRRIGGSSRRRGGRSAGGSSGGRAATGSQEYHEA